MCPHFKDLMKSNNKVKECLQQRNFKQYSTRVEKIEMKLSKDLNIDNTSGETTLVSFSLVFPSRVTNIHKEVLIFDEIGLLGTLGGSLGLFIGFSLFGYIIAILDVILDKLAGLQNG